MSEITHKVNETNQQKPTGKRSTPLILAFAGGICYWAGASIASYGILTLISFILLANSLPKGKGGFVPLFFWGCVAFGGSLAWMLNFGTLPWLLLTLWHLVMVMLPVLLVLSFLKTANPVARSLAMASAFVLGEWLLGWGDLGVTMASAANPLADNLLLLQLASVGGATMLSFLAVFCGLLIGNSVRTRTRKPAAFSAFVILFAFAVGAVIYMMPVKSVGTVRVAGLQGLTADGFNKPMDDDKALLTYERLTAQAAKERPDIIIWPETSIPGHPNTDENLADHLSNIASASDSWVYMGAILKQQSGLDSIRRNVMLLYDMDGLLQGSYEKLRLTPFGEYVPFRDRLPDLDRWQVVENDYAFGRDWPMLNTAGAKFGFLLCSESMFSDLARVQVSRGANILSIPSNDSWFGRSNAVIQLHRLAKLRAVESGRSLARVSETGRTVLLDAKGRAVASLPLYSEGVVHGTLNLHTHKTLYQTTAAWELWTLVVLIIGSLAWGVYKDESD